MESWIFVIVVLLLFLGWMAWNYFRVRRAAKFVGNAEFEALIHGAQLVDIREPAAFRSKHILGARNLPAAQLEASLSALRKDKPVLIYDASRSSALPRVLTKLKKAGYTDLYVLQDGFDYWTGKTKEN
ncbi:rhodanese-like domain-containing protein [Streptococcus chenjunshii]|uniref:Rhodanese-like domain-containing protein n=1 Tax=Streptococcus chenjunshii TaxID=2173853 RepID=A0A372KMC6_9STRE|nr:rhodanese-like domain-containing protein [Streptococcus chenjunshii]AXQ78203.1 rhodanese-like domain-containing protein [Streptococcus chenjunshii]RFU50926.1 rhodanese-like domain-containing protein [Streptococcus chenjunshii]RFU53423.1 rhodanese-like domain-containing protein [Streptococcus chenjunshii]